MIRLLWANASSSSLPHSTDPSESGLMTNTKAWAAAIPRAISFRHCTVGAMSSQSHPDGSLSLLQLSRQPAHECVIAAGVGDEHVGLPHARPARVLR